ncbi:phosphatase [Paraglaciecola chathamensis]|jgi:putative hydrolase|uniref:Phosphatase n=1 Tax=Paraglaciecola chathamensis TaxID=368405 RepID=A0A8H9I6P3_9ALTE|nr:phosphatase [Paraglaciecola oceanifecundans]GGZ50472.1 putative phosphatase [Paraglaciecola oceanifecundans]
MTLLVDTHSHTVASTHAYSTVQEYAVQAKLKGMQMFSLTEHGPTMPDSPHPWHFGNRHVLPRFVDGIAILRAIEANIMPPKGGHDIPNGLHPFLDFAIASFHEPVFAPQSKAQNTQAMIKTIETGDIQIIGHPGNPNFPIDIAEVIRAAKDNNVVLEINNSSFKGSRSGSAPNCKQVLEITDQLDWKVVFSSDAHVAFDVGNDTSSMASAKEVGFPMERVVNRDAHRFVEFLGEHNKSVVAELQDWLATL